MRVVDTTEMHTDLKQIREWAGRWQAVSEFLVAEEKAKSGADRLRELLVLMDAARRPPFGDDDRREGQVRDAWMRLRQAWAERRGLA